MIFTNYRVVWQIVEKSLELKWECRLHELNQDILPFTRTVARWSRGRVCDPLARSGRVQLGEICEHLYRRRPNTARDLAARVAGVLDQAAVRKRDVLVHNTAGDVQRLNTI